MRRLLPLALVLLSGCPGATTSPTLSGQATTPAQTSATGSTGAPPATSQATTAAGVEIPAACVAGFTAYLKAIEPVVAGFDPTTAIFGAFFDADDAAGEKGIELMTANGARATYSCPEVGLEFAYFDSHSPWAAIHAIATAQAPGTEPYLQVKEQVSAIDNAQLSDYDVATCDDAVARIKQEIADQTAAGTDTVDNMSVTEGIDLLGLYKAYLSDVQDGACPADALGNDEFGFIGSR
jgi:hypothetical protein